MKLRSYKDLDVWKKGIEIAFHHPYRPASGIDAAIDEFLKYKKIKYDAAVVDDCLRLFKEKGFRLE